MASIAPELILDQAIQAQVDGVATVFASQYDYIPGTVLLYHNGVAYAHGNGIQEIPPRGIALEVDVSGRALPPRPTSNVFASYHA